jgi:hypothetical protein
MSWEQRKPEGIGDIENTDGGFTTGVSIPLDDDGYLGRECPACEGPFKIHGDDYEALPEDPVLTCPYCGHEEDRSSFLTSAQVKRVEAAAQGIAEQYVHDALNDMLGKTFRGPKRCSRRGSFISVETSYKPGRPPPIKALPEIVEEHVRARRAVLGVRQPPCRLQRLIVLPHLRAAPRGGDRPRSDYRRARGARYGGSPRRGRPRDPSSSRRIRALRR